MKKIKVESRLLRINNSVRSLMCAVFSLTFGVEVYAETIFQKKLADSLVVQISDFIEIERRDEPKGGVSYPEGFVFVKGQYSINKYDLFIFESGVRKLSNWKKEHVLHQKFSFPKEPLMVLDVRLGNGKIYMLYSLGYELFLDVIEKQSDMTWKVENDIGLKKIVNAVRGLIVISGGKVSIEIETLSGEMVKFNNVI